MVKGVWKHKNADEGEYSFQYTNQQAQGIVQTFPLREFMHAQYLRYIAHVCRQQNGSITKKLLFAKALKKYFREPWRQIAAILGVSVEKVKKETENKHKFTEMVQKWTSCKVAKVCSEGWSRSLLSFPAFTERMIDDHLINKSVSIPDKRKSQAHKHKQIGYKLFISLKILMATLPEILLLLQISLISFC